jgi:hypothetical protein
MLYLMLFTVLAIGLAAASTLSVHLANTERCAADAPAAAASGFEFVRYQLGHIKIPADAAEKNLLPEIADGLAAQLDGSPTLNGKRVAATADAIDLPGGDDCIAVDSTLGGKFHAQITTSGAIVYVRIVGHGRGDSVSRAIQLEFRQTPRTVNGAEDGIKLVAVPESYEEVSP